VKRWRLDAALRIRKDEEDRAAIALRRAVAHRRERETALVAIASARDAALGSRSPELTSVAALLESDGNARRFAASIRAARALLEDALRVELLARVAHVEVWRAKRALEALRERELTRVWRAREAAVDEEWAEAAMASLRRRSA
jgi:hypothetical protein